MMNDSRRFSHSLVDAYLRCPAQAYYRYVERLERPTPAALVKGRACDEAWNYDMLRKLEDGADLPLSELLEVAEQTYRDAVDGAGGYDAVEWGAETSTSELDSTIHLTTQWRTHLAPEMVPTAVQLMLTRELPSGRQFIGYLDLEGYVDGVGAIIDNKTGKRKMSRDEPAWALQPYAYAWLKQEPVDFVFARAIDTGKSQSTEFAWTTRTNEDIATYDALIEHVEGAWERGDFPAKPSAQVCGGCQFKDVCPVGLAKYRRTAE